MGILTRLAEISKAAINEALDKLEQPDMMLNHYVRSKQEEIHDLRNAVAKEAAAGQKLEKEIAYYNSLAEQNERRAREAVAEERTAEARIALEAKMIYSEKAAECAQAYEASKQRSLELTHQLEQASNEYASMQAKRDELIKRAQKLETQAQHQKAAGTNNKGFGSASHGFHRIEEAIIQKEMQLELAKSEKAAAAAAREALIEEQLKQMKDSATTR